jgi:hypothetical protein
MIASSADRAFQTQCGDKAADVAANTGWKVVSDSPQTPRRHTFFRSIWITVNILLLFSLIGVLWSSAWEYSTRRYLKGFSDAIVPFSAPPIQKIQSILAWMSHTPARFSQAPASLSDDRDPTDTLNYDSLLRVCGTATNAFINLADSSGLTARRLLLLDANRGTMHVVAEVLVDGRWIVIDPTFHAIFHGPNGETLTSVDLANPGVFAAATKKIPGYDPSYVFDRTAHIRMARFGAFGMAVRRVLDTMLPYWEGSSALSIIVERESLGMTVLFTIAALLLLLVRTSLRWYGESRLGVHPDRMRNRLRRLGHLLLDPAD